MRDFFLRSVPPMAFTAARHAAVGLLAGWGLLAIGLSENVSNLGYLVLGGGFWTLTMLVGLFGLAGAVVGAVLGLAVQRQAQAQRAQPQRAQPQVQQGQAQARTQAAYRAAVARLQLLPARAPRRARPANQALR